MIIPSIDIMDGRAVQLVGGQKQVIDAGDPRPIAERFRLAGEIAVVDLDAALGRGSNTPLIEELVRMAPCRVGGGIRDVHAARRWLDAGAARVVLGTAARFALLEQLPPERVIVALDAREGEVVVEGWTRGTGRSVVDRMRALRGHAWGFLVTFIEREGRMQGTRMDAAEQLVEEAGNARLTVAGGITAPSEIADLDRLGADAQVGMALYTDRLSLADAIAAPMRSDRPDGLWATVVCDRHGVALGLAWSDAESLREAVRSGRGVYRSRSRGLWVKGDTSGASQDLLRIDPDCDRDALRFTVDQHGAGFCHRGCWTCWGPDTGLSALARRLQQRARLAPAGSYTRKLLQDPALLASKLSEEARELAAASGPDEVTWETADLLYFTLVAMVGGGVDLPRVEAELERRSLRLTRKGGGAKTRQEENG